MPVGGICCGQVYLSGDGRLWHWDIFNQGVATDTGGIPLREADAGGLRGGPRISNPRERRNPRRSTAPAFRRCASAVPIRSALWTIRDEAFPVKVSLEAFSPFAPLDVDGSSLPLTVMRYTLRNTSAIPVEVSLAGALANPVLIHSGTGPESNSSTGS